MSSCQHKVKKKNPTFLSVTSLFWLAFWFKGKRPNRREALVTEVPEKYQFSSEWTWLYSKSMAQSLTISMLAGSHLNPQWQFVIIHQINGHHTVKSFMSPDFQ